MMRAPKPSRPPRPGAPAPERNETAGSPAPSAAGTLLKLESGLRETCSLAELHYFVANETRAVTRAQQVFVLTRVRRERLQITGVSALTLVDRTSPQIVWLEGVVARAGRQNDLTLPQEFDAAAFPAEGDLAAQSYPLKYLLWVPFLDFDGLLLGGMLQARSIPWTAQDITIARHLAGAAAHAWLAIRPRSRASWLPSAVSHRAGFLTAALVAGLGCVPVSMSALAPVEVVARDPFVVTSSVEGVVAAVEVMPNAMVHNGQHLVRIADTVLKNRLAIAEREVLVAEARHKQAAQLAFVDVRGRHDLGVAQAELDLRLAERDYARDLLARTDIRAERDGIAVFAGKKDLVGRPAAVGEKLMEIADTQALEFRIDLPAADAIVLHDGARVDIFLDSDPLNPVEARLVRADYQARLRETQQLAFRLVAELLPGKERELRLGVRGTAQVYSDKVPLAFYLFRRPIAAARQWIGL